MKAADHKTRDAAAQEAAKTAEALRAAGCEVPNLDGMSTEPGDLFAAALVFGRLAAYADHKGRAMELRAAGDIPAALSFEAAADRQYAKLPDWAKW